MIPEEFIRTLYLGDRACKAITVDSWNRAVRVHADCISRVRDPSGEWRYYTDEDIRDGVIVFSDVDRIELRNEGSVPNDSINGIEVVERLGESVTIEISIDAVEGDASRRETLVRIRCKSVHLEDPSQPGVRITK